MSEFYKMDPSKWDLGTSCLSLEEEAALLRIVNAIYKHDAPIPCHDRVLAGMFRCSTRKARSLLDALVKAGKVWIDGGLIHNDHAISELVRRGFTSISRAEAGAKGGRTRAENAAKAMKDNNSDRAIASTREEKRREDIDTTSVVSILGVSTPEPPKKPPRKSRIPPDWEPDAVARSFAESQGLSERDTDDEASKFRDYHCAKGSVFADHNAAWRTWCRNAATYRSRGMAGGSGAARSGGRSSIAAAAARSIARMGG